MHSAALFVQYAWLPAIVVSSFFMLINRILIHYGEIALKGGNRPRFQRQLEANLAASLRARGLSWRVSREHHRVLVEVPDEGMQDIDVALEAVLQVAGVAWCAPAEFLPFKQAEPMRTPTDVAQIRDAVVDIARARFIADATFAVRVKRTDKDYPLSSVELERDLGAAIIEQTPWKNVNLNAPHTTFSLDVDARGVYIYCDRREGIGGLPVGTAGRVVALLSGGLDSPVAVYLAARRGCEIDCIHFTASRMQQHDAQDYKVAALAKHLSGVALRIRLWLIPYLHFDAVLTSHGGDYGLVLFRRFMMRVAERVAQEQGAQALITGDNLCQVASQTLENLTTTSRAVDMPILRPLITYDKQEIVDLARRIGTYELSIQPYKDCCALVDRYPRTRSSHEQLSRIEQENFRDYKGLVQRSLDDALVQEYRIGN